MRNTMKSFGFLAVVALAVLACNKVDGLKPVDEGTGSHTVTILLNQPETKTSIVEGASSDTFLWSADDGSRFAVWENTESASAVTLDIASGNETMAINATFSGSETAPYTYKAIMAKNVDGYGKPYVPDAQNTAASSYDPDADILVGKPVTESTRPATLSMQFQRPVVINKMTLNDLTDGETVTDIMISSDKNITGVYDADNVTEHWSGGVNTIVVGTSEVIIVPSGGTVPVYFVTKPVDDAMLSVKVLTDAAKYEKVFTREIDLIEDQVTYFSVSGWTRTAKAAVSLAFAEASVSYTLSNYGTFTPQVAAPTPNVTEISSAISYSIAGDPIYSGFDPSDGTFTLNGAAGTATITATFTGSENYLPASSSYTVTVKAPVTLSFADAVVNRTTGDYNGFSGQVVSATPSVTGITYSWDGDAIGDVDTDTGAVSLNGAAGTATVTASFAGNADYAAATPVSYTITVSKINVNITAFGSSSLVAYIGDTGDSDINTYVNYGTFTGQTTAADQPVTLTYAMAGDAIGTVDIDGTITLNGTTAGTATVTASFAGNDVYNAAMSQSYTITVKTVKKATLAPTNMSSAGNKTDSEGNTWSISATEGDWVSSDSYVQVGNGKNNHKTTDITITSSSAFSEIKEIHAWAGAHNGHATHSVTTKIKIGGEIVETSGTLTDDNGLSAGGDECAYTNTANKTGIIVVEISGESQANRQILYFKQLFVVYAE